MSKTRSCNYSLEAPDDEQYHSKNVEQSRNSGIINCPTQLHLAGHFYKIWFTKNLPFLAILSQINPFHTPTPILFL